MNTAFSMTNFSLYGAPPFSEVSYGLRMNGPGPISSLVHNFNGVFAYTMPCRFNHACRTKLSAVYRRAGTRIVVEGSFEMNSFGLNISCIIDGKDVGVTPPDSLVLHRRANSVPFCDARGLSSDSEHSLNFSMGLTNNRFPNVYFDTLKMVPSASTNLENAAFVYVHHNVSMVVYNHDEPS